MLLFFITLSGFLAAFYSFVSEANLSSFYALLFSIGGTILAILIDSFITAACGCTAGLVGSSSSPISGIGLIVIIALSLVILPIGADILKGEAFPKFAIALAIFVTSAILVTAVVSDDDLQNLKAGYLVSVTPWKQQVSLFIGCIFGSLAITPVLNLLYRAYGSVRAVSREGMDTSTALVAPQASLMGTIVQGISHQNIEWKYIAFRICVGIFVIIINKLLKKSGRMLPPLAVGIGIYLPPSVNIPLVIGGILRYLAIKKLAEKYASNSHKNEKLAKGEQRGTLFISGLIMGENICGVVITGVTTFFLGRGGSESPLEPGLSIHNNELFALVFFTAVVLFSTKRILGKD